VSSSLLLAARDGDGEAFRELIAPHLPAIHLLCYRMLGSYHDADEAMQDVLLRAWRFLDSYRELAPLRHWLYRIATTSSLKLINERGRLPATVAEIDYLEPYPDRLLDTLPAGGDDPATVAERRESVSLAFIAALQLLPATQRAVLILRDVLAWHADEVADLLETTVAAVNSALQRARASVRNAGSRRPLDNADRAVLARFIAAWHSRDVPALAELLREDVELRMPPEVMEFLGRDAVLSFFTTVPAGGAFETIRLVPDQANGQLAVSAFERDRDGEWRPYGIMVMETDGERVAGITGFPFGANPWLETAFALRRGLRGGSA
jgi:RNA polymerase sigma-70 factor (ECF subfamily)